MKTKLDYFNLIKENIPSNNKQIKLLKLQIENFKNHSFTYLGKNPYIDISFHDKLFSEYNHNRKLAIRHNIDAFIYTKEKYKPNTSNKDFLKLIINEGFIVLANMIDIVCQENNLPEILITPPDIMVEKSFITPQYKVNIIDAYDVNGHQNKSIFIDCILNVKY